MEMRLNNHNIHNMSIIKHFFPHFLFRFRLKVNKPKMWFPPKGLNMCHRHLDTINIIKRNDHKMLKTLSNAT